MIFSELYELYWVRHAQLRLKCPDNVKYFFQKHGARWAAMHVEDMTEPQVQDWFDDTASRSKSAAVRAVNMLAAIINWGIRRGYIRCANPCRYVQKFKLKARERFLMPDEIERFKRSLLCEAQHIQDLFWLCLLTGARRGNVQSMEWGEIDTTLAFWRIPPDKHKNDESHLIPLTAPALAILSRRKAVSASRYVFPSKSASGHVVEPKRAWKRILKRAKISDLRIHDLRRTLGSYLAIKGESPYIIGKALGHIDQRSTAVYARLHLEPVRVALKNAHESFL